MSVVSDGCGGCCDSGEMVDAVLTRPEMFLLPLLVLLTSFLVHNLVFR